MNDDDRQVEQLFLATAKQMAVSPAPLPAVAAASLRRRRFGVSGLAVTMTAVLTTIVAVGTLGDRSDSVDSHPQTVPKTSTGEPSSTPDPSPDAAAKIEVLPLGKPEVDPVPRRLYHEASRLAGLVDDNPALFSGSWYDANSGMLTIGVVQARGAEMVHELEESTGMAVATQEAARSLREGLDLLATMIRTYNVGGEMVDYGPRRDGSGFTIGVRGSSLDRRLRHALNSLPGRIVVYTGLSGGSTA
ncbi:MAG TPA: hypothetical protein VFK52_03725 [Nocardioidaceae bacterium]|nr:hypothetical protein [Nocardioidaceae bacterium]